MKIIHFSDIHIHSNNILGHQPIDRFQLAMNHLCQNHLDADLFIITGDIADNGKLESYKTFNKILNDSKLPKKLFPKLILGNHDDRKNFINYFKDINLDENGFVQYTLDFGNKRLVFLDTNKKQTHKGHYCKKRQKWLKKILEQATHDKSEVYLFMHHNPLPMVKKSADFIGLQESNEFKEILKHNLSIIKHIFFGHQHLTTSGNYLGIPFSSPRSTNHPLITNYSDKYRLGQANTDPNYNIILINKDSLIVHSEDFLRTNIDWFETVKKDWFKIK